MPLPDDRLGERACAAIIARPGHTVPTLAELQEFLDAEGVAKYTWPESVEVFDEFPRTPSLKVVKRDVVKLVLERSRGDRLTLRQPCGCAHPWPAAASRACPWRARRGQAGDREAAPDEEVADLGRARGRRAGGTSATRCCRGPRMARASRRGSASRDRALLHPARQERGPGELEVAHARARELPRLLLARRRAVHADQRLLGDEHAVALHLVLRQVERGVEHGLQRLGEVVVLGDDAVELLAVGLPRPRPGSRRGSGAWTRSSGTAPSSRCRRPRRCRPTSVLVALLAEVARSRWRGSPRACCATSAGRRPDWRVRRGGGRCQRRLVS